MDIFIKLREFSSISPVSCDEPNYIFLSKTKNKKKRKQSFY